MRCMRYFNLHHIARDCKRPRKPPTDTIAIGVVRSPRREVRRRHEVFSAGMPRSSNTTTSMLRETPREDVISREGAATGPTPSPPPSRSPPPPLQLDAAVVCFLLQRDTSMVGASDPMLLEWEICFSAPLPRATWSAPDTSPPSEVATVQAGAPTAQDEPIGDSIVPASPTSSEDRLDFFLDVIQKKPSSPLLTAPTRLLVPPTPCATPNATFQGSPTTS
jgi:hypothetical protein